MKAVIDLQRATNNADWYKNQFNDVGRKHILFINPQLSGKHFYKMILPYITMYRAENIITAVQYLSKYSPKDQLLGGKEVDIPDYMIEWANFIVFPFTTQPLVAGVYSRIRAINPSAIICYQVDFNFYELPENHPYKYIFDEPSVIDDVEDNIVYCDKLLLSNKFLGIYMHKKLTTEVIKQKYTNQPILLSGLGVMPYLISDNIVFENMKDDDFSPQALISGPPYPADVQQRMDGVKQAAQEVVQQQHDKKEQQTAYESKRAKGKKPADTKTIKTAKKTKNAKSAAGKPKSTKPKRK